MSEYFPKPRPLGRNVKLELDLSNYTTKTDLKKATSVDTSEFAKKTDLASLKSDVDELDVDQIKAVPLELSKPSSAVDNDIVKKTEYNKLVAKINATDTTGLKSQYNTDKSGLEKKINGVWKKMSNASGLAK